MKKIQKISAQWFALAFLALAAVSFSAEDFSFVPGLDGTSNGVKLYRWDDQKKCAVVESTGSCYSPFAMYNSLIPKQIRIRVLGAHNNSAGKLVISRPFLIIDGINLDASAKSLDDFNNEILVLNSTDVPNSGRATITGDILGGLKTAGYTPILVQFTRTTNNSLAYNSAILAKLLTYLSSLGGVAPMVWPTAGAGSYNILGISQGGVLGRYGAYLYDTQRSANQPGIRLFASLDSPHQGAVVPRGVFAAVDFWGRVRSQAPAKEKLDLLSAPGASQLLINGVDPSANFAPNTSASRWLYGTYRQATTYTGFPAVLLSNGQLNGKANYSGTTEIYKLNRWAEKGGGSTWGRAISRLNYAADDNSEYAYNREYQYGVWSTIDVSNTRKGSTKLDFVQGSTYPFFSTLYDAFHAGFYNAIPDYFEKSNVDFYGKWAEQSNTQKEATFIPTTSSLDLLCAGDLSVRNACLYDQTNSGIDWENPGSRSTAKAIYAVDPTHPNGSDANSGKHVTGATATLDLWRLFCEVAKADWDPSLNAFRNPSLTGNFDPLAQCMNKSAISPWFTEVVAPTSFVQTTQFPWARWTYNASTVDKQFPVAFTLPAGWNTVATLDRGQSLGACDVINVTLQTNAGFNSSWLHTELVLSTQKGGAGWWQLGEQTVPVDGLPHDVHWQLPCNAQALQGYRWAKLILNSNGGGVTVTDVHITNSSMGAQPPVPLSNPWIVPVNQGVWSFGSWGAHDPDYSDALGYGIKLVMPNKDDGAYWDAGEYRSFASYTQLKVLYWPGTCQHTRVYFDKRWRKSDASSTATVSNAVDLVGGSSEGGFLAKTIDLNAIIDTKVTPLNSVSAQRLYAQTATASETCIIKEIKFQ